MSDDWSLDEAKEWLRDHVEEGATCPCCTQFAKVYRRKIHSRMARDLIKFYRLIGLEWGHATDTLGATAPDFVKLTYWSLLERQPGVRDDGSPRIGWWRITDLGRRFVLGELTVLSHARIYDGRCLGLTGEPCTIVDAIGDKFDYRELMSS